MKLSRLRPVVAAVLATACASLALALTPKDFARQWPVQAQCPAGAGASCEGAFAVTLDESVYRQVLRADLGDLAAFNAEGAALPFGPMPAQYAAPPGEWRDAAWFPLPPAAASTAANVQGEDLHLHVRRTPEGELSLDASLKHGPPGAPQDILVDVREKERVVEGIVVEPQLDARDFSLQVAVEASSFPLLLSLGGGACPDRFRHSVPLRTKAGV